MKLMYEIIYKTLLPEYSKDHLKKKKKILFISW